MRILVLVYSILGYLFLPTLYKVANEYANNILPTWGTELGNRPPYPYGYKFLYLGVPITVVIVLKHLFFDKNHGSTVCNFLLTFLLYSISFEILIFIFGVNLYYIIQSIVFSFLFSIMNVYANYSDDISYLNPFRYSESIIIAKIQMQRDTWFRIIGFLLTIVIGSLIGISIQFLFQFNQDYFWFNLILVGIVVAYILLGVTFMATHMILRIFSLEKQLLSVTKRRQSRH